MKRNLRTVLAAALAAVLLVAGLVLKSGYAQAPVAPGAQGNSGETLRTVSVSGHGEVQAQPDQAVVVLGVQTQASQASQALTQNNQQMQALIDALRNAGIAAADIQTQFLQLQPRYSDQNGNAPGTGNLVGFTAINTVQVQIRNLDNLGDILDAAIQAGGNTINSINFLVSDQNALLDQARQEAMNDAQHKAEQLANLAGAQLGEVLTINESGGPVPFGRGGAVPAAQAEVPIQPGTQTISLDLQVTWLLNPGLGLPGTGGTSQPATPATPTSTRPPTTATPARILPSATITSTTATSR